MEQCRGRRCGHGHPVRLRRRHAALRLRGRRGEADERQPWTGADAPAPEQGGGGLRALVAALLLVSVPAGAERPVARSTAVDPTAQSYDGPLPDRGALVLKDAFGGAHRLAVEIADTKQLRTRGLMWRSE